MASLRLGSVPHTVYDGRTGMTTNLNLYSPLQRDMTQTRNSRIGRRERKKSISFATPKSRDCTT